MVTAAYTIVATEGDGTAENPFTVSDSRKVIDALITDLITPVFYTKGYVVSTTQFTASRHLRSQWHHHCEAIAHTPYNNTPAPHSIIEQGAVFLPQRSSFLIVGKFLLFTFKLLEEMNLYRCQFILGTFFKRYECTR
jgi:hypothetical protein